MGRMEAKRDANYSITWFDNDSALFRTQCMADIVICF